jgi:hypothetical protein
MNEDYAEGGLGFSGMSDGELLEIVNSSSGRYRQEMVDGARNELGRRGGGIVRAESDQQVMAGGAQPPASPDYVPGGKLFSVEQITVASLFAGPIAGCLLLARNWRVLGKGRSAWLPLTAGVASTGLLIIIGFSLPEKTRATPFTVAALVATYYYAKQSQGAVIDYHLKAGGRRRSWAAAIATGLGCVVVGLVLFVSIAVALDIEFPPEGPVAKVKVSQSGEIELDGTIVTLGQLRYGLTRLKEADGVVWYYRERPTEPPPPAAEKVIRLIVEAELPVRISSKPDYSDYIDAEGRSVPAP